MASTYFRLVAALLRYRCLSYAHHSYSLPGAFTLLVSRDGDDVKCGLKLLSGLWGAIAKAETWRHEDKTHATLWAKVPFAAGIVVREVLMDLAQ